MIENDLPHFFAGSGVPLVVVPGLSGRTGAPARLKAWMQLLTGYHPIARAQPGAPAPARCVALAD